MNNNPDYVFQVTSHELEIPMSNIHIRETTTDSVPNGPPTGASTGTDLNGMAVVVRVKLCMFLYWIVKSSLLIWEASDC